MSLYRTERPSRDKEKAIKLMQTEKPKRVGFLIPADLKKRLKMNATSNNTTSTDIILTLIEKYLKMEEQKDGK
jgi:predicted DNA-binding protein